MKAEKGLIDRSLDQLSVGIGVFDAGHRLVFCNRSFQTLRHYPDALCVPGTALEDMLRFNAERGDFGPGDMDRQVAERLEEIRQSGEREIEREMADGQILNIRYTHLDEGGLTIAFEDKTEERHAQRALALSEERYALVSEAADEAIYEWDIANNRFFASPRLTEFTGKETDTHGIRLWSWEDGIHPDDLAGYAETLAAHRSGKTERWECEYRLRNADGEYRWVSDHGTSIRDEAGQAIRMIAAVRDITDRVERDAALAASEERYQLITQATSDGIYDWNMVADTLYVSEKLKEMFGFVGETLHSSTWAQAIHADDIDGYVDALRRHLKGQSDSLDCEYRISGSDGTFRWVRDHGVAVRRDDGRAVRLVGAVRDVTDLTEAQQDRDQAESRLLDSLETISDGYMLVDAQDRVQLWNRRYLEIFANAAGTDISDIVVKDRPFLEMIRQGYERGMFKPHPDGADGWIAERRSARDVPAVEFETELANGQWLRINERRMSDGGRVTIYTDITDFKRRERELEAARLRFEDAIESLSSGFALFDAQDRIVVCNTKYRDYFPELSDMVAPGTPFTDILRKAVERGVFPQAVGDVDAWLQALLERRSAASGIREQHLKGGLWLQVSDHRTKDGGIVSIYTDVTELKNREEELRRQSAILEATLENMDQGISMVDSDLNVVTFNRKFLEYMQFPENEFQRGFPMEQGFRYNAGRGEYGPGDIDEQVAQRLELAARFEAHRFERTRNDGTVLEIVGNPIEGGGFVTTYSDISEAKRRESDLIAARDAAQKALRDLELAQERLVQVEKLASLGQLTAGIAHEIKNPLNFVNNFAKLSVELLEELEDVLKEPIAGLDEETRDDAQDLFETVSQNLTKINEHGRRADSIVKNMLLHSRDGPSLPQTANINTLADEALNLAYHGARAENTDFNVEMERDFAPDAGEIECYQQDLMRVFLNLFSNGMYASTKRKQEADGLPERFEPTISVATRNLDDRVEVVVRDNGTGIPKDIIEKVFSPFFTTKPAGEGTGLGLSLSFDIVVKQHGGDITVDSEPGAYTAFVVTLPRALPAGVRTGETSP